MKTITVRRRRILSGLTKAGSLLLVASLVPGCVVERPQRVVVREPAPVIVYRAPPQPRAEPVPPPPSERVVWDPGHWRWDGHDWDWVPGHYEERPYREAVWVPGHWAERNGGWFWVAGGWRER